MKVAPAIAPLFRSENQLAILAELFAGADEELGVADLARRAGVNETTALREVDRLVQAGLLKARLVGRSKLVRPNFDLPWARTLRQLLVQTAGALPLLRDALIGLNGIEQAFIFGSYAARFHGERGAFPHDIDLLIIGDPDRSELHATIGAVEREIGLSVNPIVASTTAWRDPNQDSFLAAVKAGALLPVLSNVDPDR
jgi:hypothetical protein